MIDERFWRDRRVFITGHTGFKGGWLAMLLARLGAKVFGYSLPPTEPSLFVSACIAESCSVSTFGDVRDPVALTKAVREADPEIVFHLAAQPLVRASYADPTGTYATNVMGAVNLLDAVRNSSAARAIVVVTSDKCYENREWLWGYRERDRLGGVDPYSSSKACVELVCQAWSHSYFRDSAAPCLATARAGNVIGGGDWANDRLLPDMVRAAIGDREVILRYPRAVRPWQHVLDPLAGYLVLAAKLATDGSAWAGPWNFGPNDEGMKTVEEMVERASGLWPGGIRWRCETQAQPHEAGLLMLDCAQARERLGWQSRISFDQAVAWSMAWYCGYQNYPKQGRQLAASQIEHFLSDGAVLRL